ncbi:hypothetical protein MMC19_005228 [Ptychographa xylographoides]|nr:hypothetical protein [Ptychographa xylographoides]
MDHLPIPDSCQQRAMTVPYLGLAPAYDIMGFEGFPERLGLDEMNVLQSHRPSPAMISVSSAPIFDFTESFLQEWLWFGVLHEFSLACEIDINLEDYIRTDPFRSHYGRIISTEPLLNYVRNALIHKLMEQGVPLSLKPGDRVYIKVAGNSAGTMIQTSPYEIAEDLGNLEYVVHSPDQWRGSAALLKRETENGDPLEAFEPAKLLEAVPLKVLSRTLGIAKMTAEAGQVWHDKGPSQSRVASCLRRVRRIVNALLSYRNPVLRIEIALSIDILCASLADAADSIFIESTGLEINSPFYQHTLGDRMRRNNWCRARTPILMVNHINLRYIASNMPSYETVSHNECRDLACSRQPKELQVMSFAHRRHCDGDCQIVVLEEQELISILNAGGIPGVQKTRNAHGATLYRLVDVSRGVYVAISHVWAHGLGNPQENALPLCQVEYLFQLVQAIGSEGTFLWIDTLSVPIKSEYKRNAILGLRDIYRKAAKVLVLDRHLQQVGTHWLEMRVQVLCSEWMKRLWTLQEGRLASDLYIQFRYQAVPVSQLLTQEVPDDIQFDSEVFGTLYQRLGRIFQAHFAEQGDRSQRFVALVQDLAHRSVTVASDEAICIATLLGLNLEAFHPFPTMADIYRSIPHFPPDLLFVKSTKLEDIGFRWAPSTFLERNPLTFPTESPVAFLSSSGFHVSKDCIMFRQGFKFYRDPTSRPELYFVHGPDGFEVVFECWEPPVPQAQTFDSAAIILQASWNQNREFQNLNRGVLVSGLVEKDSVWHCHFEMNLHMWRNNEFNSRTIASRLDEPLRKAHYEVHGEFHELQAFCVD